MKPINLPGGVERVTGPLNNRGLAKCGPGVLHSRWLAFGAALALHVAMVFWLGHFRNPDMMESGGIAANMLQGRGFSMAAKSEQRFYDPAARQRAEERVRAGHPPPMSEMHATSLYSPGYPFLLYASWKLLGMSVTAYLAVSLLQAVLVSSLIFPVHWLARRWFGLTAAAIAMWIVCFMPLYAYYATRLLPVAVCISIHPWLLFLWLALRDRPGPGRAAATGACTGLAALFQPMVLAVFGLVGAGLLVERAVKGGFRRALALLVAPLVIAVALAPWTIRNYRVHGRLVILRQAAGPFWIGNNPHATGAAVIEGGMQDIYTAFPPQCIARGTELTEAEYHHAMKREALAYIRSDPGAFARRTAKKIFWFWTIVPRQYVVRHDSKLVAGDRFRYLHMGYWYGFLVLALAARLLGGRFKKEYVLLLAVYILTCSAAYGLLHVGQARFRGEIEYIVIPAAAQGAALLWRRRRAVRSPRAAS